MKTYKLKKTQGDEILLEDVKIADTFFKRLVGLMGKTLEKSEGLLIKPCNSIHCFFMKIPIDVIFLDETNHVIHKIEGMKPWKVSPIIKGSKAVIEASAGALHKIQVGDQVRLT